MNAAQGRISKKILNLLLVGLLIAAGVIAYLFLNKGSLSGNLYVYYPTNTSVFIEIQPKDSWDTRLLRSLSGSGQPVSLPKMLSGKIPPVQNNLKSNWESQFKETFKPDVSFGAWINNPASTEARSVVLSVLPLKENLSLKTLVERFAADPESFTEGSTQGTSYLVQKEEKATLAIVNRHLLVTNNPQALEIVLINLKRHAPHLFTVSENLDLLANLPRNRQGTFLINANTSAGISQKLPASVNSQFKVFQDLMPLTAGSIEMSANQMTAQSFTPLHWDRLQNEPLKTALKNILLKTHRLEAASTLPENTLGMLSLGNVDQLIQFYFSFIQKGGSTQALEQYQRFLTPFQLDIKRDVIGLFSGETVLAYQTGMPAPIICLVTDEQKKASLNKIIPLLSMSLLPIQVKTQQLGSVSVQSIGLRGRMDMLGSFAFLDDHLFALSPVNGLDSLIKVKAHQAPTLQASSLYQQLVTQLPQESWITFFSHPQKMPAQSGAPGATFKGAAGAIFPKGEDALESRFMILWDDKTNTP